MHYTSDARHESPGQAAHDFCRRAKLKEQSVTLLSEGLSPAAFFRILIAKQHFTDAIRMLAHRLSRREAVWWACLCLEHDSGDHLNHADREALLAATRWVMDPTEVHRRAAASASRIATFKTPAGILAKAVFWSGGSISRPEYPVVPPLPHVCAQTVASSLLIATANYRDPAVRQSRRKEFLDIGVLVEKGELHWDGAGVVVPPVSQTSAPTTAKVFA